MNALRGTYYIVQESLLLSLAHHLSQCSTDSNGLRAAGLKAAKHGLDAAGIRLQLLTRIQVHHQQPGLQLLQEYVALNSS
jgi:hypothetical protein